MGNRRVSAVLVAKLLTLRGRQTANRRASAVWAGREARPTLLLPVGQTARSRRRAGGVELFLQSLDISLVELAQLGNLDGETVAGDLILLRRCLRRAAGGAPGGRRGGLHVIRDGRGDALVGGAPDAVAIQRGTDFAELTFQLDAVFAQFERQGRRGIDGAPHRGEPCAGLGRGLGGRSERLLQFG